MSKRPSSANFVLPLYHAPDGIGFPDISHLKATVSPTRAFCDLGALSIFAGARKESDPNC